MRIYDKVVYKNDREKVKIICRDHGPFFQGAGDHLQGHGCPKCWYSRGEERIREFLQDNNIEFMDQYKLPYEQICTRKYDFYLPDYNILIEFDGEQHFKFVSRFHRTQEGFEDKKYIDAQKTAYAINNGHRLVRVDYKSFYRLPEIIDKALGCTSRLYLSSYTMYAEHIELLRELSPKFYKKIINKH